MLKRIPIKQITLRCGCKGGELYQDADDANLAALVFAVGAIVVGGPLASVYGVMAAYAYYEAATGDYEDPAGVAPYVSGDGISPGGRAHSGGSKRF